MTLAQQVFKIKHLVDTNFAPFGYDYVDCEEYEYRWFKCKTLDEVKLLIKYFELDLESFRPVELVDKWICISMCGEDFDEEYKRKRFADKYPNDAFFLTTFDNMKKEYEDFLAALDDLD